MTSDSQLRQLVMPSPSSKCRQSARLDLGGWLVSIPIVVVCGARPGPRVSITASMHGGEFLGIETARILAESLEPHEVSGTITVCLIANPPAVYGGRTGSSPLDGLNINRVFPGDPDGSPTERLACWLLDELISGADAYIDLHSGGIDESLQPFVGYRLTGEDRVDAAAYAMAEATGIQDIILGREPNGGNSHAVAARSRIPAVLIEYGDRGDRDSATATEHMERIRQLLRRSNSLSGPDPSQAGGKVNQWAWSEEIRADVTGLWYPDVRVGSDVVVGQPLGRLVPTDDVPARIVRAGSEGRVFYGLHALTARSDTVLAAIASPLALAAERVNHHGSTGPDRTTRTSNTGVS